jgi:hypothetical protein
MVMTSIGITLLVALMLWLTWDTARRGNFAYAALLGSCALVCAYAVVIGTLAFITDLDFMRLDVNGFETQFAWMNRHFSWNGVGPFMVRSFIRGGTVVTFDDATRRSGLSRMLRLFPFPQSSILSGQYGLGSDDMARLMNEWRARALGLTPWIKL